jgi:hypothetical protein
MGIQHTNVNPMASTRYSYSEVGLESVLKVLIRTPSPDSYRQNKMLQGGFGDF